MLGRHAKGVGSGTQTGRRSSQLGGLGGAVEVGEHVCHRRNRCFLLTSFPEVPTRGIQRRGVVGTRHATLQRPGKRAYSEICSISDGGRVEIVQSVEKKRLSFYGRLRASERLFHRRSMKKMR